MTPKIADHLTEEALDDVLIGLGSRESEAHAAACSECRGKLDAFRADVALFNRASIAWSENRSGKSLQPSGQFAGSRLRFAFLSWAAIAAVLAVTALGVWRHTAPVPPQAHVVQSMPVDSEAQIAEDNQLLEAINTAIGADEESPVKQYKLLKVSHSHLKTQPRMRTR